MKVSSMVHTVVTMTTRVSYIFAFTCALLFSACKSDNRQVTADMIHFPDANGEASDDAPFITFEAKNSFTLSVSPIPANRHCLLLK